MDMGRTLTNRERAKIDRQVESIVRQHCSGLSIDVMKIGEVFKAAYSAALFGADITSAVVAKYKELAGA